MLHTLKYIACLVLVYSLAGLGPSAAWSAPKTGSDSGRHAASRIVSFKFIAMDLSDSLRACTSSRVFFRVASLFTKSQIRAQFPDEGWAVHPKRTW